MKADITGDTVLLHMCLVKGGEIINYPEVTSCYRVTGRGVWSMLTQSQQDAANKVVLEFIQSWLPLKYRLTKYVIEENKLSVLAGALPKPVNE